MTRTHLGVAGEALPPSAVTHILLDPPARKNPDRSTSTAFGRGVSHPPRRRDWISRTPYRRHEPFAWRLTRAIRRCALLVIARRREDGVTAPGRWRALPPPDGAEHGTHRPARGGQGPNG